jgi:hypothetical protein
MEQIMAYKKGQTGNPRGRPRKVYWDATNVETELANATAKEGKVALSLLIQAMEAKESWAFQVFFGELMPKIDLTDKLPLEIDQTNPNKIEAILTGLLNAIGTIEYVTIDEACKLINALSALKHSEMRKSVDDILTEELHKAQLLWSITPEQKEANHYVAA